MANPTTNYGFVLPTSSDLVTDLPADFDVALQGVDTRLKALQPGTTLGDLDYSSATANTNTRLGIGTTGQVLTVSGGVPAWATPAGEPAWTTWSPTVTGLTKGNGTEVARYRLNGKMVDIFYQFTLGSTSSVTGQLYLTPPFHSLYNLYIACAFYSDSGSEYPSAIFMPSSIIYLKTLNTSGTYLAGNQLNGTTPFTWGTGDFFNFNFSYEVA